MPPPESECIIIEDSEGEEDSPLVDRSENNQLHSVLGPTCSGPSYAASPSVQQQQQHQRQDRAAGHKRQLYKQGPAESEGVYFDGEATEARRGALQITGKAAVPRPPEVKPEAVDPNQPEPSDEEIEELQMRMATDRQLATRLQRGEGSSRDLQFARDLLVFAAYQRLEQQLLQGADAQHSQQQEQEQQAGEGEEDPQPAVKKRRTKSSDAAAAAAAGASTASGSTRSGARVQRQQARSTTSDDVDAAADRHEPALDTQPPRPPHQQQQQRRQPAAAAAAARTRQQSGGTQQRQQQQQSQRGRPPRPDTAGTAFAAEAAARLAAGRRSGHGPREQQRLLRSKLSLMERVIEDRREDMRDSSRSDLAEMLQHLNTLGRSANRPREAAQHAGVLNSCLQGGVDMVRAFTRRAAGRHPRQLVRALKAGFALTIPSDGPTPINWEALGDVSSVLFRTAPGLGSMLGALEATAKARKQPVRRARQAPEPEVRPLQGPQAMDTQDGMSQETQRVVTEMRRVLAGVGNCSWIPLVLDHDSFAHTVENVFALSFLTKDMWVQLDCDPEQGLVVSNVSRQQQEQLKVAAAQGGGRMRLQQFMMNLDMHVWDSMKQLVAPGECLMPQRPVHGH